MQNSFYFCAPLAVNELRSTTPHLMRTCWMFRAISVEPQLALAFSITTYWQLYCHNKNCERKRGQRKKMNHPIGKAIEKIVPRTRLVSIRCEGRTSNPVKPSSSRNDPFSSADKWKKWQQQKTSNHTTKKNSVESCKKRGSPNFQSWNYRQTKESVRGRRLPTWNAASSISSVNNWCEVEE